MHVCALHEIVKRHLSQSTPLTHFHEELSLLHHGLASFTAFLDHSVAHQTPVHAALTLTVLTAQQHSNKCNTQLISVSEVIEIGLRKI